MTFHSCGNKRCLNAGVTCANHDDIEFFGMRLHEEFKLSTTSTGFPAHNQSRTIPRRNAPLDGTEAAWLKRWRLYLKTKI
ncbi:MAG: hypothetical protein PHV34_03885 [Verrucomicrobiae bacterium]|nr:hypothetical protein [Verrucomicrobiae bacterium]